eukprot:scaffold4052_cov64-Attheya_sp.AAC.8
MHIDGGTNIFVITNKQLFYILHLKILSYTQASGSQAQLNGVGIALFRFARTSPAFYVPDNPVSTFSPGALKYYIGFRSALHEPLSHCSFIDPQDRAFVLHTQVTNNLDFLDLEFLNPTDIQVTKRIYPIIAGSATQYPSSQLIHQRLGHINNDKIRQMWCAEQHLTDLPKTYQPLRTPCPICIATKEKRIPRNPTSDVPLPLGTRLHIAFTFFNIISI